MFTPGDLGATDLIVQAFDAPPTTPTTTNPGWPSAMDCIRKLQLIPDVMPQANLLGEIQPILDSVIAEFQSPIASDGSGGTGRNFSPITEVRYFDGKGYAHLHVDDIVPGTLLTASANGIALTDVVLTERHRGLGYNLLVRNGANSGFFGGYGYAPVFVMGQANIAVAATWGYAAQVPADVREAVRCEVTYRALVTGVIGVNGVGEEIEMTDFKLSTSVGAINFRATSPLTVFHDLYLDCVRRYRDKGAWRMDVLVKRMS